MPQQTPFPAPHAPQLCPWAAKIENEQLTTLLLADLVATAHT